MATKLGKKLSYVATISSRNGVTMYGSWQEIFLITSSSPGIEMATAQTMLRVPCCRLISIPWNEGLQDKNNIFSILSASVSSPVEIVKETLCGWHGSLYKRSLSDGREHRDKLWQPLPDPKETPPVIEIETTTYSFYNIVSWKSLLQEGSS